MASTTTWFRSWPECRRVRLPERYVRLRTLDYGPSPCYDTLITETTMTYTHELLQTLTARELSLIADLEAELGEKLTEAEILDGFFKDGQRRQYAV